MNGNGIMMIAKALAENCYLTKNTKEINKILSLKLDKSSIDFLETNYQLSFKSIKDLELFKLIFEQTIDNYNELTNSFKNVELF